MPITRGQRISPEKVRLAKMLRRNMTSAETLLWSRLRGSALHGLHFRRQQVISGYIVDFYCVAARLAVELDGPVHDTRIEFDRERDQALTLLGIRTIRVRNEEVSDGVEALLDRIFAVCAERINKPEET